MIQIFEGESSFYCPQDPSSAVDVPMGLKKDAAVTVLVQVYLPLHWFVHLDTAIYAHLMWQHVVAWFTRQIWWAY